MSRIIGLVSFAALAALTACAEVPTDPVDRSVFIANNDPLEPLNRDIFDFNQRVDRMVLKPVAIAYRDNVPTPAQTGIRNVADNLGEPVIFINNVLQARFDKAFLTFGRFFTNSIFGFGGFVDVASASAHVPRQSGDFGQTLYAWGVENEGPYLMLPFFGPSNPRDLLGSAVDVVVDPVGLGARSSGIRSIMNAVGEKAVLDDGSRNFEYATMGITVVSLIDTRARNIETLDELERSSLDYYAKLRSVIRQLRNTEVGKRATGDHASLTEPALADPGP